MKLKYGVISTILVILACFVYLIMTNHLIKSFFYIESIQYDKNLTLALGGGGNSAILNSDTEVLVIDTKFAFHTKKLHTLVKAIAGNKPVIVISTHLHPDHVGGNALYNGSKIYAGGNYTKESWEKLSSGAALPTDWIKDTMELKLGDETVIIKNIPYNIHTKSDVVVYLKNRKMLFTGDIVLNEQAPFLNNESGADSRGYLRAFDELQKLYKIEKIIPGHGAIGGSEIIPAFKQYFEDMRVAADQPAKENEMLEKYKNWRQLPMVMSNKKVIQFMRHER